jgi:membrane fusion protein, peptide pheromone/bacteriocin exporter
LSRNRDPAISNFGNIYLVMIGLPEFSKVNVSWEDYTLSNTAIVNLGYWLVCLSVAGTLIFSGSFVFEISTSSPGLIRPISVSSSVHCAFNGQIKQSFLRENQFVKSGDTLYTIESEALNVRQEYLLNKFNEIKQIIVDLRTVTSNSAEENPLHSALLQQSWVTYLQKIVDAKTRLKKAQADYRRNLKLHIGKVIADAEFETYTYELDRARNEVALVRKTQMSQWQAELRNYEKDLRSVESELAGLETEIKSMIVRSPISGTVQGLIGIYPGSVVYVGQELAQISPDSDLIVEAFVSPNHIGLLRDGMQVRFLIDAFNYNQWGFGQGKVMDISDDIHIVNDKPVFRIRCSLDRNYLQLKNGYKGMLKKGMSLQARFIVTERTLWQLIYDNVNDWLNPGR